MPLDSNYRTADMALAVVLQLHGFTPVLEREVGDKRILFCFNPKEAGTNGELDSLVADYDSDEMLVEPKRFMIVQKKTRERLYDLMGTRDGRKLPR